MRLLTAVSLVRAQQGEPKKSRLPFGSLLFLSFVLFAQANYPCAQRPSAVNWRSRCRCRWQKKAARAHVRHPCFTRTIVRWKIRWCQREVSSIPGTARVDSGNYRLYPHERSFATAVSLGTVLSAIADLTGYGRRDIINP